MRVTRRWLLRGVAVAYIVAVVALTLLALAQPGAYYYLRFAVLFPFSFPLLYLDWWGAIALFGPDPDGAGATAFFVATATAAAIAQLLFIWAVLRARERVMTIRAM